MVFGRKRTSPASSATDPTVPGTTEASDRPDHGPWDAAHNPHDMEDSASLDFGSLILRGRPGFALQLPEDDATGTISSVVLGTEDGALELRAFADSRSGGAWDLTRAEMLTEVQRLNGTAEEVEGRYGTELRLRIPATLPDGQSGYQPSRIVGVEGPRWFLRATFLGSEAMEPTDDGILVKAFEDVVVVRGDEPRTRREPLLITINPRMKVTKLEPGEQAPASDAQAD